MKAEKRHPQVVRGIRAGVTALPTTVLKTHSAFPHNGQPHPELALRTVGFVYVMRNPLDMLLSYINFTRMQYARNPDSTAYRQNVFVDLLGYAQPIPYEKWVETTLDDIPRRHLDHALARFTALETEIPGMRMAGGSWLRHCLSWRAAADSLPAVQLRYEDLLEGPERFLPLQRLFLFSEQQVVRAASSVDQGLRALQQKKIFFNKMTAYYFPQYFSASMVRSFLDRFDAELQMIGYGDLREIAQR